jgi:hypothetical protein
MNKKLILIGGGVILILVIVLGWLLPRLSSQNLQTMVAPGVRAPAAPVNPASFCRLHSVINLNHGTICINKDPYSFGANPPPPPRLSECLLDGRTAYDRCLRQPVPAPGTQQQRYQLRLACAQALDQYVSQCVANAQVCQSLGANPT